MLVILERIHIAILACALAGCRPPPDAAPEPPAIAPAGEDVPGVADAREAEQDAPPSEPPVVRITSCRTDHPCGYGIEIEKPGEGPMLLTVDEDRQCRPSLSPDGEHLAFLDGQGLKVVSTRTGSTEASFDIHADSTVSYDVPGPCIVWSPEGLKLALVGLNDSLYDSGKLVVLDLVTGARHSRKVKALVLCGDGCYTTSPLWTPDGLHVIVLEPRIHVPDPPLFRVFCGATGALVASLPARIEDCDGCYADMFEYGWTDAGNLFFGTKEDRKIHVEVPFDPGGIECPAHEKEVQPDPV
jgi:hypothetical protein